ncbi:hypothetical protein TBLA_0I01250 [Henningerozyma blattae CBS 6284]|uniref:G domain-containing protein n=1 Tax=Henningerozyma blattae (strain ATCC 34711 / CBS 6284 / DSM 70876 / NBRC 10599 / NRRL Y-10934 / UCD 77-7) TaxID=1071380 RepID=I2H8T3_HENB6|nr:hypothetical protein TBLA_0I01250 [Tetrapisispora blattae CBS 6284]CCH62785.1 hypothetical protein TBLA_0I01250 [Tetrapisispora blattae CBS 6284]
MSKVFLPRYVFPIHNINIPSFQGHQNKAINRIIQLLPQLNLILELRDIRAPLTTHNVIFDKLINESKRSDLIDRVVVYTRQDSGSVNNSMRKKIDQLHKVEGNILQNIEFIDARSSKDARLIQNLIRNFQNKYEDKLQRPLPLGYKVLIAGPPNVGKSTLINSLRRVSNSLRSQKKVAKTGGQAGVTRNTSELIRILPNAYVVDTPGVGFPVLPHHRALPLALCGSLKDGVVDPFILTDYLLYLINLHPLGSHERYPGQFKDPTNDIYTVLERLVKQGQGTNINDACNRWLNKWKHNKTSDPKYSGLFYDPELLLPTSNFSYDKYIIDELKNLEGFKLNWERNSGKRAKYFNMVNDLF